LLPFTRAICAAERYVVVKIDNFLFINLYLPCSGTTDRHLIIEEVIMEVYAHIIAHDGCTIVLGGDFNCDLDTVDPVSVRVRNFFSDINLHRCDLIMGAKKMFTYCNDALGNRSCIDFVLMSDATKLCSYEVLETGSNLSDHQPVIVQFISNIGRDFTKSHGGFETNCKQQRYLRWDKADLAGYYGITGDLIQKLLTNFSDAVSRFNGDSDDAMMLINDMYNELKTVYHTAASSTVPVKCKNFYKFWWCQELDTLKENSIRDHNAWKEAGKPRSGPVFKAYRTSKLNYKKRIREYERQETFVYTNDLHDALLNKQGPAFWKCWRSKFEHKCKRDC
jgi:hypothetical protein